MDHIAGYTVAHDVSARDWQLKKNGKQWLLGKTFDTFCPFGPAIVTRAAISGIVMINNKAFTYIRFLDLTNLTEIGASQYFVHMFKNFTCFRNLVFYFLK